MTDSYFDTTDRTGFRRRTVDRDRTHPEGLSFLKTTWPLHREHWRWIAGAFVTLVALYSVVGLALSDWFAPNAITEFDNELAQSLADGRTERNNDLAHWGAFMADTYVKIAASLVIAGVMLWRWRRWHEAALVGFTLIFEASVYATSSTIVGRPRPDVDRLLESPVATSFPSGHVAAATVYSALAVIVFWHTKAVWARALAVAASVVVALTVAWARMYQGMHFLSDVSAGIVLGLVSVWIGVRLFGRPNDALGSDEPPRLHQHAETLDPEMVR
ncbi:MAG: phosphatase PAP2 family protein [Acidimicrobiales bacterium]|nr:phosphatase PAP2 family protein [Acidimicrobiales bacterium]